MGLKRSWGPGKNCNTDDSGGNMELQKDAVGL